jgi:hypothetical protein
MAKKKGGNAIGGWAFLAGVVLAVIIGAGFVATSPTWTLTLVIIGLVVGLLNITGEETKPFLLSGTVLIIASSLGQSTLGSVAILDSILDSLMAIFVPATVIVAIRNVFSLARK